MNRETGNNKGTGFVKFKDPEVARKLLAKSDEYNSNYLKSKNGGNIHDIFSGRKYYLKQEKIIICFLRCE